MISFSEELERGYRHRFQVDAVLYDRNTGQQRLTIFENEHFGRVMALNGIVQTTEKDEFIYHEMLAHVPLLAHGAVQKVLIIGGGDGGILRETTRHAEIAQITQVEIDAEVIELCRRYLPNHSQGAFDDPRVHIEIADGLQFVTETPDRFDVIICDGTDPVGPGVALFSPDFYAGCRRCLTPGGILVTQNGVAFSQLDEIAATARALSRLFVDWHFYSAAVPTYVGGIMAFGWACNDPARRCPALPTLRQRFAASNLKTRYYTPELHLAAFALPQYVLDAIGKNGLGNERSESVG